MLKRISLIFLLSFFSNCAEGNFMFYQEGKSASIQCTGEGEVQFWLPKGSNQVIDANTLGGEMTMNDNGTLEIETVKKKQHEGTHLCITKIDSQLKVFEVHIQVKPLPPISMWEARYKRMFITGFVSSLVCFCLFAGICLINKYQWRPPPDDRNGLVPSPQQRAYDNPAMEEDPDTINVRM